MLKLRSNIQFLHGLTYGATPTEDGCYFVIWAPNATGIVIHFYTLTEHKLGAIELKERKGGKWIGFIEGAQVGMCYAIEALGEENIDKGYYFKKGRFLVDPYARALNRPFKYDEELYLNNSEQFIPKCIIKPEVMEFDWQGIGKPYVDREGIILYEAHIRSMTMLNPKVPPHLRGTYLGFCHESVIEHLKRLKITTVQIMPVAASMSEPHLVKNGLVNYWGYNPVCFMAPDPRYACDPNNVIDEFKTMVRELHRNNISVILDVVFNHTAEGGIDGPVVCYKGLDAIGYYSYEIVNGRRDLHQFLNYTGCGNTFDCDNKIALRLVYESMVYWTNQMRVDGFRFDLGVTPARDHRNTGFEFNRKSSFFKLFTCDRYLNTALLIGEPWDLGPGGYRLGGYPTGWSEQNDKFRDTVRRFWRGDPGLTAVFATRLMGSRDVFAKGYRSINASVNYVTYHDGFTLEDLVSYSHKHNELNGENNRDGTDENFSSNCGVEGPTKDRAILKKRRQLKRNFLATVIISQGIPHILSGDELCKSQRGNNNSYCQDNDLNYLDWTHTQEKEDLIKFIGLLCSLRKQSKAISELNLDDDNFHILEKNYIVKWRLPSGHPVRDDVWESPSFKSFLLYLGSKDIDHERWCLLFNASDREVIFNLPITPHNKKWSARVDTSEEDGIPRRLSDESGLKDVCAPWSLKILYMETLTQIQEFETGSDLLRHLNRMTQLKYGKNR
ncbi:Glycogen debranching enzyme [Anaerobiospirillum thomasii]|uniref:glycogen debranching protein GlgX n=1 Tax=Anaerobiospirillum thomasii TaxID=179995 RepID=UPI000D82B372|nr:glycogen debranching protein GlgX [Anaerobiospirillum thomasii]SPT71833.1 Glycogen debranching enzyme [Anaerobiospirillum thomasii]